LYLPDLFWKYKRPITLVALLGISCLVLVDSLNRRWIARAGGEFIHSATYPVQKVSQGANDGAGNLLSLIPDIFRARAQNTALQKRIGELEQEIVSLRETVLRERRLHDISEFSAEIKGRKLTARVIGVSPTAWFNTVVVDKGSSDGVKRFMPAVSASGVAGYVMEVYRYSSKILLLTDSNSKVSVIAQRSRARGVVQGTETGGCLLKYVEATADVAEGDILVTSGDSKIYPEGLLVGRIEELRRRPGDLFQSARVTPETDFAKIEEIALILDAKTPEIDIGAMAE
jgi:rod shape-determining protein MreC